MIVLRTPKGWTCPKEIDGKKCEGYWRAHQVPMADMDNPEHVRILEGWMKSYRPEELFDESGRLVPELAALPPTGHRRMSDNPHANGGLLLKDLKLPDFRSYAVEVPQPGAATAEATRVQGTFLRDVMKLNLDEPELPPLQPRREQLEPLAGRPRRDRPLLHGRDPARRRSSQPRRARHGGSS